MAIRGFLCALFFGAFLAASAVTSPASAMSLGFSWGPTKKCFDSKSPPMRVGKVPKGTRKLRFRMVDLNAPNYPHGGGTVAWSGKRNIPYGAFRYKGPCPPSRHTYQFTVEALGAGNKVLGRAKARRAFP
ncbi:hypothetical protein GGD81_004474 [Rhodobium orientis]|nr:phospholipid-binding protein [Rhodobium orientis]MBB4305398.1 hypothetical protein [Rhodobium orientis]